MNTLIDKLLQDYTGEFITKPSMKPVYTFKSELLKAIMECQPKKFTKVPYSATQKKLLHLAGGHNQALTEWENNIKALFGENKEG